MQLSSTRLAGKYGGCLAGGGCCGTLTHIKADIQYLADAGTICDAQAAWGSAYQAAHVPVCNVNAFGRTGCS